MVFARRLAIVLFCMTFGLILLGGIVHTTGASLACPDWPLCFGQVFPRMQGGVLYEHGHRLLASAVALVTIALFIVVKYTTSRSPDDPDQYLSAHAAVGIALVFTQAALGGLTVILKLPTLVSTMHLATSMLYFAWATWMWVRLSAASSSDRPMLVPPRLRAQLIWGTGVVYAQIVLGAFVRHSGASMTCGRQALWCNDQILPVGGPQWVQSIHRILAWVALAAVVVGTLPVLRAARLGHRPGIRRLALSTHILVTLQIILGVLTLKTGIHLHVVTTHLALGALLWSALIALIANTATASDPARAQKWEAQGDVKRPAGA